jgi:DNA-binding Lrp family transcriptional regulator
MLKGQDILVLLKLVANRDKRYTYYALAKSLGMSPSEVHAAIARLAEAGFLHSEERIPNRASVYEFLVHGLRYVFPLERKFGLCRGMATAQGALFVRANFESNDDPPPVWPDSEGDIRGMGVSPVYRSAPKAARSDENLYRFLVLCDLLRGGQAREKEWAAKRLKEALFNDESIAKYS